MEFLREREFRGRRSPDDGKKATIRRRKNDAFPTRYLAFGVAKKRRNPKHDRNANPSRPPGQSENEGVGRHSDSDERPAGPMNDWARQIVTCAPIWTIRLGGKRRTFVMGSSIAKPNGRAASTALGTSGVSTKRRRSTQTLKNPFPNLITSSPRFVDTIGTSSNTAPVSTSPGGLKDAATSPAVSRPWRAGTDRAALIRRKFFPAGRRFWLGTISRSAQSAESSL